MSETETTRIVKAPEGQFTIERNKDDVTGDRPILFSCLWFSLELSEETADQLGNALKDKTEDVRRSKWNDWEGGE